MNYLNINFSYLQSFVFFADKGFPRSAFYVSLISSLIMAKHKVINSNPVIENTEKIIMMASECLVLESS